MTQELLSFEQLPKAVTLLTYEVRALKRMLSEKQSQPQVDEVEKLMSVKQTAEFLNLTVPTIYTKVSKREIPFMKRGKRLYFSSTELMEYLKEGRKKTNADIEAETELYLNKKGVIK